MVSQNLADLINEQQLRIWFESELIFHDIKQKKQNMEKSMAIFPCFMLQYDYRWKFFHPIRAICGKFSIYQHCYIKPAAGSGREKILLVDILSVAIDER